MTSDEILTGVLAREGGHRPEIARADGSTDPETMFGITWDTFQSFAKRTYMLPATKQAFLGLTPDSVRPIYELLYITEPGFTPANIPYEPLRVQLIDFGINSGPERAIRWLQRVLHVPAIGRIEVHTRRALQRVPSYLVNDALVAARAYMIDQAVDHGTIRRVDEEGLESRALSFFLAKP